jgi:hypothetical protein
MSRLAASGIVVAACAATTGSGFSGGVVLRQGLKPGRAGTPQAARCECTKARPET